MICFATNNKYIASIIRNSAIKYALIIDFIIIKVY